MSNYLQIMKRTQVLYVLISRYFTKKCPLWYVRTFAPEKLRVGLSYVSIVCSALDPWAPNNQR